MLVQNFHQHAAPRASDTIYQHTENSTYFFRQHNHSSTELLIKIILFSQIETYQVTHGKVEPGVKGYEIHNLLYGHKNFVFKSSLLMVDADFCRG